MALEPFSFYKSHDGGVTPKNKELPQVCVVTSEGLDPHGSPLKAGA